jgi:predicted Zn-dependent peptidase
VDGAQPRIVVVGATSAAAILPVLEDAFGHLTGDATPSAAPPLAPHATGWLVHRPGFEVAQLSMVLPGPAVDDPDAALADLLMAVLASEFTSRIPMDLRETRGLAYSVSGRAHSWRGDGRLRIDAEVDVARAAEALLALDQHLDRVLEQGAAGFSDAELRAARNTLLVHHNRKLETVRTAADTLGELLNLDRELSHLRAERTRIATATADDLAAAAAQWLPREGRVWILTGDRPRIEPALEAVDRVPDRVVGASTVASEP